MKEPISATATQNPSLQCIPPFSSQSISSKGHRSITPRLSLPLYPPFHQSELPTLLQKEQEQTPSSLQNDSSHRLFTFMDEKEAQRKFIQEFLAKKKVETILEANTFVKRKQAEEIGRAMSRKKRETVLKRLMKQVGLQKGDPSKSEKKQRGSRSRLHSEEKKFATIEIKDAASSKSKSPVTSRCSTPCLKQKTMQKCSNIAQNTKCLQSRKRLQNKTRSKNRSSSKLVKQNNMNIENEVKKQHKHLLKKKQQLERQLNAVNYSLTCCRKIQQHRQTSNLL